MSDLTLFGTAFDPHEAAHKAIPNFYNVVARQKLGVSEAWQWHTLEVIGGGDVLVTGAVPVGYRRDGSPKWPTKAHDQRAIVTDADLSAARDEWTLATGLCWNCGGSGKEMAGWSRDTGRRYRDCSRCSPTPTEDTPDAE